MDTALHALAEPRRRAILNIVRDDEKPAGEIAAYFDVTRPAISQHLKVLKDAGLLEERRDGTRRLYRARREGLREVREYLETFWSERLLDLKRVAEQEERRGQL
jgi:DNA-binding transcriptional ArsR family regulator